MYLRRIWWHHIY